MIIILFKNVFHIYLNFQILSEEKIKIESMAEGLEEESKKSLQMEAELEKQMALFNTESKQLKTALNEEEKK